MTVLQTAALKEQLPRLGASFSGSFDFPFVLSCLASSSLVVLPSPCHTQSEVLNLSTYRFQDKYSYFLTQIFFLTFTVNA